MQGQTYCIEDVGQTCFSRGYKHTVVGVQTNIIGGQTDIFKDCGEQSPSTVRTKPQNSRPPYIVLNHSVYNIGFG